MALHELRDDIGRTLHTYTSTLMKLSHSLKPIARGFGSVFPDSGAFVPDATIEEQLESKTLSVLNALSQLALNLKSESVLESDLREGLHIRFDRFRRELSSLSDTVIVPQHRLLYLRDVADDIVVQTGSPICREKIPDIVSDVNKAAKELHSYCCACVVRDLRILVSEMYQPVQSLRERVVLGTGRDIDMANCLAWTIITNAVNGLAEFAKTIGVRVEPINEVGAVSVRANERLLTRAVENLLHNGIKYSWSRGAEVTPWVTIRLTASNNNVQFVIRNTGVAIHPDEISSERIFDVGYRGRYSSDRLRPGTGIGLHDAREIAKHHGGNVTIESVPAHAGQATGNFKRAFRTTVTLSLPISDL